MNKKLVFNVSGRIFQSVALLMLLPMIVSIIYKEASTFYAFFITIIFSFFIGTIIKLLTKKFSKTLYAKEGFVIVSLAWIIMSLVGSLPFYLSGEVTSYIDCIFETVSGFTTTGSSILTDVEALSHGLIFWRSFTHWIGGMGVLVFILAFVSSISDRSIHILKAEMPGPIVGKITPRSKDTSKVLYLIYSAITITEIILLWCGDMNLFDSIVHSLGTAGTGGFGIKSDSVASYSAYSQWVITVFMFICGINFNLFYLIILKRFSTAIKSTELKAYALITVSAISLITLNVNSMYTTLSETIRHASFQVVSVSTTTGYATTDFNMWPMFSKTVLLILMFIGACAGSTAGGLKVSRVVIMLRVITKEIKKLIHPRSVSTVKFEDKDVEEQTQKSVTTYMSIYFFAFLIILLIISFEPFDMETILSATVTCFNNVGPGLAGVGPMSSFADFSVLSKITLSFAMLLGRLEIFPLIIAFMPSTWKKNN